MHARTSLPVAPTLEATAPVSVHEAAVERVLALLGLPPRPDAVHDAVIEAMATASSDRPASVLARAVAALGVRAHPHDSAVAEALDGLADRRPVLLEDGLGACWILGNRRGAEVGVERLFGAPPEWFSLSAVRDVDGLRAWSLDPALPLSAHTGPSHGHDDHSHHVRPEVRLLGWLRAERQDLGAILVYALFIGLLTLTLPAAAQALVTTVALGTLLQPLVILTTLLLGALAFSATLRGLQAYVVEIVQRRIFVRVVADLSYRLPRVEREANDSIDAQELVNRFFDTFILQKAAADLLLGGLEIALTVTVGMIVLAFYDPMLLGLDVVLVIAVTVIVVGLGRRGVATAVEESKAKYAMAAWLEEIARHDSLFKLGGGLTYAELRAEGLAREWLSRRSEHFSIVFRQTVAVLALQAIANAAVLGLGGFLVLGRRLTLGQLVAAELIVTVVVSSLAKIGKHLESYYDLLASIDKIGHLSDLPIERIGGASCSAVGARGPARLVLDRVSAGYAESGNVLEGASLVAESGARVAITGATGSGKSLLVELVAALRTPRAGCILIDDLDVRDLDLAELRSKIAVVRSEVVSGSILDNVRLGRREVDVTRARRALARVGILDDVEALPDGLRTVLTPSGEPLSSSQKTRLAVARAIAGEPVLLVLEESIDGLDPRVREPMLDFLFDRARPWTLVVTSNDPRIHARCDTVYRLEDGRLTLETSSGRKEVGR